MALNAGYSSGIQLKTGTKWTCRRWNRLPWSVWRNASMFSLLMVKMWCLGQPRSVRIHCCLSSCRSCRTSRLTTDFIIIIMLKRITIIVVHAEVILVFICVYFVCFCFVLHSCSIIVSTVEWTWWDWSLILRTLSSFSALTLLVGSFDL